MSISTTRVADHTNVAYQAYQSTANNGTYLNGEITQHVSMAGSRVVNCQLTFHSWTNAAGSDLELDAILQGSNDRSNWVYVTNQVELQTAGNAINDFSATGVNHAYVRVLFLLGRTGAAVAAGDSAVVSCDLVTS